MNEIIKLQAEESKAISEGKIAADDHKDKVDD